MEQSKNYYQENFIDVVYVGNIFGDIDKQIIYEQRRAEEDIELRKHQYGDDEDTSNN